LLRRILRQLFVLQHIERRDRNLGAERVSTVRRPVLTGLDLQHDFVVCENSGDREDAAGESWCGAYR
jgi:hypothetical protein